MSSSADTNTTAGKPLPVYKRRRRRIYGTIAVVVIVAVALIIWAVTQGGSSAPTTLPNFTISVSQGTVASPAALSGAIDAAYVYGAPATDLIAKGDHSLVNAEQIAKLGVPGLDVIAVASSVIKSDPTLVQDYVCAELQGSKDMTGPDAAKYLTASAKVQGITGSPQQIVTATEGYPFIPPSQQLYWLGSTLHDPTSRIVKAYQQTGTFLVSQGRLTSAPPAAQIAQHIDITFVKKALSGGCPS